MALITPSKDFRQRLRERLKDRQAKSAQYIKMLIENDQSVPWYYSAACMALSWSLLAGFLVLPSTFTSISRSEVISSALQSNEPALKALKNPPLLIIACALFFISTAALGYVWWTWKHSYVWVLNHIVMPILSHSLLGLGNTLLNVYSAQEGAWSAIAIAAVSAEGTCLVISLLGYIVYNIWLLRPMRQEQTA